MAGLIGAFLGLLIGFLLVLVFQTLVYPGWRRAHEKAKVTASHGTDPSTVGIAVRVVSFILLPVLGFTLARMVAGS
jgi:hypothetical protein